MTDAPLVSVVITTRNRRDELLRAVASAWAQTVPLEVIVIDDASDDGTPEAVETAFPETRVLRSERQLGYIAQRNRGAREARAPYFTSFDDDAELISPRTLEHALGEFDHERIAAVGLPTIDLGRELILRNRAPDGGPRYVADTYPGAAALIARAPFLALGGYREELVHRGEESELSRRLLNHGMVIRLSTAPEVHHHVSARRQLDRDVYNQARSQVLQTAWSLPWRTLPRRMTLSLGHAARNGHLGAGVRGLAAGLAASYRHRSWREPLSSSLAALDRRMEIERIRQRYTLRLEDLEPYLPPLDPRLIEGS